MADALQELKEKQVLSHRILTMLESMGDITGHVFIRVPGADEFMARCRNDYDVSPGYVQQEAIHRINFDGIPTEPVDGWTIPPERHIGAAVFRMRPEVGCVIHAHPPAQVLCVNTGVPIRPIVGAQNGGGSQVARGGIPVYPRALLIHNKEVAGAMMAAMGRKDIVLLKGHGNVVAGRNVEEATVRAIQIENLARLTWEIALTGRTAPEVPWQDIEETISRNEGGGGGNNWTWEYYKKMYEVGRRIPVDPE